MQVGKTERRQTSTQMFQVISELEKRLFAREGTKLAVGNNEGNSADQLFLSQTWQNDIQHEDYLSKGFQTLVCIQIPWRACMNMMPKL